MHEMSLVKALLSQVDRIRSEQDGLAVDTIDIEVGPLSGVEPLLVQSAFEQVAPDYGMSGARLIIDEVPLTAECGVCGVLPVESTRIECPTCANRDVRIVGGDEFRLKSVTIQCPDRLEQKV